MAKPKTVAKKKPKSQIKRKQSPKKKKVAAKPQHKDNGDFAKGNTLGGRTEGSYNKQPVLRKIAEESIDEYLETGIIKDPPAWLMGKHIKKGEVYEAMNRRLVATALNGNVQAYNAFNAALGKDIDITTGGESINNNNAEIEAKIDENKAILLNMRKQEEERQKKASKPKKKVNKKPVKKKAKK